MKICKVNVSLNRTKFVYNVITYNDVKETKGSYMFKDSYSNRRVDKEKIMLPETMYRNTLAGSDYDAIQFSAFCREEEVEAAMKLCVIAIKRRYTDLMDSFNDISAVLTDHDMPSQRVSENDF